MCFPRTLTLLIFLKEGKGAGVPQYSPSLCIQCRDVLVTLRCRSHSPTASMPLSAAAAPPRAVVLMSAGIWMASLIHLPEGSHCTREHVVSFPERIIHCSVPMDGTDSTPGIMNYHFQTLQLSRYHFPKCEAVRFLPSSQGCLSLKDPWAAQLCPCGDLRYQYL